MPPPPLYRTRPKLFALAAVAGSLLLAAVAPAWAAILARGVVTTASGAPIEGAEVALVGSANHVRTGGDGRFAFPSLTPGRIGVRVRHAGFITRTRRFELKEGDEPAWTFVLTEPAPSASTPGERPRDLGHSEVMGAIKLPVEQRDLPQGATIVTPGALRDRGAFSTSEAARGVAGVLAWPSASDDALGATAFSGRGQSSAHPPGSLRDGFSDRGRYAPRDLVAIERVEFLRGSGAIIDGAAGLLGGTVHVVDKRPTLEPFTEAMVAADGRGRARTTLDHSASIGGSRATYRVSAALERPSGFRDDTRGGSGVALAPVLDWPVTELTHVFVRAEVVRRSFRDDAGLPLVRESFGSPRGRQFGEPGFADRVAQGYELQAEVTHFLEGDLQLRQALRFGRGEQQGRRVRLLGLDFAGDVRRHVDDVDERSHDFASQSELIALFRTGRIEHALVTGAEFSRGEQSARGSLDSLSTISFTDPRYGATPLARGRGLDRREPDRGVSVYVQDLMKPHARVRVLVAARHDVRSVRGELGGAEVASVRTSHLSPRLGLVLQTGSGTRLYGTYARSFRPAASGPAHGDPADRRSESGASLEAGVKQEVAGGRFAWTAAAYQSTLRDVAVPIPNDDLGRSRRSAEQRSRGIELQWVGALTRDLRVLAGYAWNDAEVTGRRGGDVAPGTRPVMAPRQHLDAWLAYRVPTGVWAGLDVGLGVESRSACEAQIPNALELPSFTQVDAMLGYGRGAWRAQLNALNLGDVRAYDVSVAQSLMPREPRQLRTAFTIRF